MKMNTNIRQHDETDCGAACIASIARHYGKQIPIAVIRESSGTTQAGTTLKGIIDSCREIGFEAKAYKTEEKELLRLRAYKHPVILHIINRNEDLHFVVLYGVGSRKAKIMDPATGKLQKKSIIELQKEWTGYLVTVIPDSSSKHKWTGSGSTNTALNYFHLLSKKEYVLMMLSSAVYIVAGISTALFLQHIIDRVLPTNDSEELIRVGSLMLLIMVCTLFLGYGRVIYALRLSLKLDGRLIIEYLTKLFKLPVGFFNKRGAGELNSRIGDVSKIRSFLTEGISNIITSSMILLVSFALMFTYHWRLASMMLLFIPFYIILYAVANKYNKKYNREIIESSAAFEEKTVESITAVKVIKYFGGEEAYIRAVRRQYMDLVWKLFRGGKCMGAFASWTDAISKFLTLTLLTVGSLYIFGGDLTIGELVSFYSLTAYFSMPLSQLANINDSITEANISTERIKDIIDLGEEESGSLSCLLPKDSDILFEHIDFSYPGCPPLLTDFSMTVPSGRITAIQGESGCGKSSLASLLMRDYSVQKGAICLGDMPIGTIDINLWRSFISIVPQDAPLMGGTILENITCLDPAPDLKLVSSILKDLGMEKFVKELPLGLLTHVGQRGSILSGGQKQRIALARVLYHDPQVIILDEATSSLDSVSQNYILKKIQALRDEGKTIIMITHKDDNVVIADQLIKMNAHS